jgi:hypothetical protein
MATFRGPASYVCRWKARANANRLYPSPVGFHRNDAIFKKSDAAAENHFSQLPIELHPVDMQGAQFYIEGRPP